MSKIVIVILFLVIVFLLIALPIFAHPGRTDENGGHYDHETGEYHYHHGYPAHQHYGGTCPYDFDDKTGINSRPSSGSSSSNSSAHSSSASSSSSRNSTSFEDVFGIVGAIGLIIFALWIWVYLPLKDKFK